MVSRDDPRVWYEKARGRVPKAAERGELTASDVRAIFGLLNALDPEVDTVEYRTNVGYVKTLASKTLANYTTRLRLAGTEIGGSLLDQDTSFIHRLIESMADGSSHVGPDDGY